MSITNTDLSLVMSVTNTHKQWCVFEHLAQFEAGKPPEIVFVGATKLMEVFRMVEPRRNTEWLRIFGNGGQVMLRIIAVTAEKMEARRFAMTHARSLPTMPRCNLRGVSIKGLAKRIQCSNGKTYETQTAAADDLGVSASAISRLLRGELNTVGGHTFTYALEK